MPGDSVTPLPVAVLVFCLLSLTAAAVAAATPVESEQLDELAGMITSIGFVPGGGDLLLLASSCGWYGFVNDVIVHPEAVDFREVLREYPGAVPDHASIGAFTAEDPGVTVVVTASPLSVYPVGLPESVSPGDLVSFRIEGNWEELDSPVLAVGQPDMTVLDLGSGGDGTVEFHATLHGVYWIELLDIGQSGPEVILLFPLVSGGTPVDVLEGRIPYPFSGAVTADEVLVELNGLRTARGLPPLARSEMLDSLACIRASELALSGSTSHFSADGTGLGDLIHGYSRFAENIGRGTGFDEAWSMLLISPLHLWTCLDPSYGEVGIGAAVDVSHDRWQLVMVQVFAGGAM
jgi:hypothetical protein